MNSWKKRLAECLSVVAIAALIVYQGYIDNVQAKETTEIIEIKQDVLSENIIETPPVAEEALPETEPEPEALVEPEPIQEPEPIGVALNENGYVVETSYDKYIVVENGMEFHYVAGDTWQGLMVVVKDPSRLFVGMPRETYNGQPGANATQIASRYGAVFAVNGAFFVDTNYAGNGGTPIGFVFSQGNMTYGSTQASHNIMGWDNDNHFVVGCMTGAQAIERGIRDAVSCDPILVQDGQIGNLSSKSTTLMDCRSAVGAREDGCVLILSVDGRMSHSIGATTRSLAECMLAFGAVNAGNLDGGGSTSIYYGGPTPLEGLTNLYGRRAAPNAICVRPE